MWFKKKVAEPKTETVIPEVKVAEPPKETTRRAIMEMTLVNNKTDKEYMIKSENEFGLSWEYIGAKETKYELLVINQRKSLEQYAWFAVGRFVDFSIVKCNWQTFDIL
jgi:hypothetical protein